MCSGHVNGIGGTPLSVTPLVWHPDASHQDAAWTQHRLHRPQVVALSPAILHMHGHPTLVVHSDQHFHIPRWPGELLHKALGPREPHYNVLCYVQRRQRRDVVDAQGPHDPHLVVAVDDRHHVVAVDHGASAA